MKDAVIDILKYNQLSVTDNRLSILELFQKSSKALSHADIERLSEKHFDRVTIYRTLQTFVDKGIIHTIPTADNSIMYALCKEACSEGHHHDDHVHFLCERCGTTYCLDNISIPEVNVPKGFTVHQTNVLVNGVCRNCK
jgi:Fur family transcriptional regulator, ferric uptake regulator